MSWYKFNTTIGHDIVVGPHTVVSSGVTLGGAVVIGELTFVGMGSSIKERVTVGTQSIVGFGSVVYKDIPDGVIVLGNPARVARRNEDKKVF
jgi:acetyltransferase-like isoleucine patch superfamily enzyme